MEQLTVILKTELIKEISNQKTNMLDSMIKVCETYYNKPVHNLNELKKKNNKLKGDIFECFCKLYMINYYKLEDVFEMSSQKTVCVLAQTVIYYSWCN